MEHFTNVDWVDVYERVTLAAVRLFAADGMVGTDHALASYGIGPEDFAAEVICKLIDERDRSVTWRVERGTPTTDGVVTLLVAVLKRDIADKLRAKRRKRQDSMVVEVPDEEPVLQVDPIDREPDAEARLIQRSLRKRLEDDFLARPDDELQLYVMLQFDDTLPVPYPPRDAAEQLGVPVERIYNLKDKLERRLHRLYREELRALHAPTTEKRRNEQEAR